MKKLFFGFVLMMFFSCQDFIDKPQNLLSKDEMSEIIAEMALNDQMPIFNPNGNIETGTRFILKEHHIKPKDFIDSYEYYVMKKKMEKILDNSQKIIMKKTPDAKAYIQKKLKDNPEIPSFAR